MIVTQQDIDEFIEQYSDYQTDYVYLDEDELDKIHESGFIQFLSWLNENPQVILSTGLHEYTSTLDFPVHRRLSEMNVLFEEAQPLFRTVEGVWLLPQDISQKHDEPWGAWTHGQLKEMLALELKRDEDSIEKAEYILQNPTAELPSAKEIIEALEKSISLPKPDPTLFISPSLWTPSQQRGQVDSLKKTAISLIQAIQSEKIDLCSVSWRQFEEIVAALLSDLGMDIHINREVPQGGRDIIARGSLFPGCELVTIAVEVKHRAYVDRPQIQQAIYQNRAFPALMFVTSGHFSAGVIQEARLPENKMRLFLKDGVAIRDLIKSYAIKL